MCLLVCACSVQPAVADIYKYVNDDGVVVYSDIPMSDDAAVVIRSRSYSGETKAGWKERLFENISRYTPIVERVAEEYRVDPDLIRAIITVESNWHPAAVSPKGAMGLMQLMPFTARALSVHDPYDPEENIAGGIRYFRMLLDLFKGDLKKALAAYNAGPTRVKKKVFFSERSETGRYVKKVLAIYGGEDRFRYQPLDRRLSPGPIYKLVLEDGTLLFTDTPLNFVGGQF